MAFTQNCLEFDFWETNASKSVKNGLEGFGFHQL